MSSEFIDAGQRMLQSLAEKDLSELDILVVYIDGIQFGKYHVICAMGVDSNSMPVGSNATGPMPLARCRW